MIVTTNGERPIRYVVVLDRGKGSRMSGFLAAGVYEDDGEGQTTVVFHMEEVDATMSGRKLGSDIADFMCESLWPGIPLSLMIGTTVDGATPVKRVLLPAVRKRLKEVAGWAKRRGDEAVAARAAEEFTHDLYCANIAGAPRDVGRKITMHQRIGELTTALELERLRILGHVPLFEDVTNALRSFDPSKRSSEGKDLWDAGAREGLITALTVLPKAVGYARAYRAETGPDGHPRMVDVTSPHTGYGAAPSSYVGRSGVFGVDGTVVGPLSAGERAEAYGLRVSAFRFPQVVAPAHEWTPGAGGARWGRVSLNEALEPYRRAGGLGERGGPR